MSATRLLVVRHGETAWNVEGRIQGHVDIALNALGVAQARALGERLLHDKFDAVYASDLQRAYETARFALRDAGRVVIPEPRLRERHLGVLQGLTGQEALVRQPAAWNAFKSRDPALTLEGGESLEEFFRRVTGLVEELVQRHAGARLLLVTHVGVLDALYRHASGMALARARDFSLYNASVNVLHHQGNGWRIETWGDISHLPQELAMDDT